MSERLRKWVSEGVSEWEIKGMSEKVGEWVRDRENEWEKVRECNNKKEENVLKIGKWFFEINKKATFIKEYISL